MKPHINPECKPSFFHFRDISFIHKYFTPSSAKIIVQALIASNFDYCNSPQLRSSSLFKAYKMFSSQQPISSPSHQGSAIVLRALKIFTSYQFTFT